jgi:hypothetical protein
MREKDGHGAYVHKVREGTQRYAQDLISENERLRLLVASLEGDVENQRQRLQVLDESQTTSKSLCALVATLEADRQRLSQDLVLAREEAERCRAEQARLQERLRGAETESRRAQDEFRGVEKQNTNLANLYVASYRLHGTLEREGVVAAISEIVANLIGSEEMGVFEVRSDRATLALVGHNGIDPVRYRELPAEEGLIGRVATSGESHISERDGLAGATELERDLTAGIPLKADGTVIGVLAIFRMLPQKPQIEELDHELFDLLATHAGMALYCTRLYDQLQQRETVLS